MDLALKALDSVVGANYERKDLSPIVTVRSGPRRPLLTALNVIPAKGITHYWNEVDILPAGHGAASYPEGGKPPSDSQGPDQLNNVIARIGKVAAVTDTLAAVWRGAGGYTLKDGELERLYTEALDLQVALKSVEILNEAEWLLVNGDRRNLERWPGGQFDGISRWLTTNVTVAGTTSAPFLATEDNASSFEDLIRNSAGKISELHTPSVPDLLLVTTKQKSSINKFVGGGAGRPIVQVVSPDSAGFIAGQEVDEYQTGFYKVGVKLEPQAEIGALTGKVNPPGTAEAYLLDTSHFSRADLIPLSREPLARINTSIEAQITWEFTLEVRNQASSAKITGLSG